MRTLANLRSIQGLIHDYWFDLNQVHHDFQQGTVRLGLGEGKKGPFDKRIITVTNVLKMDIIDEAEIQTYDLNRIEVTREHVRIVSNFPLEIRLAVREDSELSI